MVSPSPDWDTKALLDEFAAAEGPSFDELTVEEKRAGLALMFGEAAAHAPEAVFESISIPVRNGREISGFSCRPEGEECLPILFLIQGGGWAFAQAAPYRPLAALLANQLRRMVVCVDFRLSPEHPFPAGLEDCLDAYVWLRREGGALGADASNIAVMGDSAGGNLAAAVALECAANNLPKPDRLVMLYPMIDVREGAVNRYRSRHSLGQGDHFLTEASIEWAANHYVKPPFSRDHKLVSLIHHPELAGLPPTVLVMAGLDPLRDEGELFAETLREAGVKVTRRTIDGTIHGFLSFFHRLRVAHRVVAYLAKQL